MLGEAPPPNRFFYWGDSQFFRYLRKAFALVEPEIEERDAGEFLALYRSLGGWRIDVCDEPQRATKGGSEDVTPCWEPFRRRWTAQALTPDAALVVSPKRLAEKLPDWATERLIATVAPPGQWNAHRVAFLRDMSGLIEREWGRGGLRDALRRLDQDEARLDFEIIRAAMNHIADSDDNGGDEVRRLLRGHPREAALLAAWEGNE